MPSTPFFSLLITSPLYNTIVLNLSFLNKLPNRSNGINGSPRHSTDFCYKVLMSLNNEHIEIDYTNLKSPLLTFLDWLDRYIHRIYSSTNPFTNWCEGDYYVKKMVLSSTGGIIPVSVKQEKGWNKVQVKVTVQQSETKLDLYLEYPDELVDFIMRLKIEIERKFSEASSNADNQSIPNISLEKISSTIPDFNYDRTIVLLWLMGYTAEAIGLFVNMARESVLNRISHLRSKFPDLVITDDERKRRGIPKKG